jgi:ubiquinone/menaquinone biosynthesis C-methylase UbiE
MNQRILDACCGSRMFWFDRKNPDAIFVDNRRETYVLKDSSSKGGNRSLVVDPDIVADFTSLPFRNEEFHLVIFDPPHLVRNGKSGWLAKKYGKLKTDWREDIRLGFSECFRVLKQNGILIFKWNENDISVKEILALTPMKPLIGNKCGKNAKTHWIVFMKPEVITVDDF